MHTTLQMRYAQGHTDDYSILISWFQAKKTQPTIMHEVTKVQIFWEGHKNLTLKFIHSEKATKSCEIFTLLLSYVVPVKSKVKISQKFVAFSEYMNFTYVCKHDFKAHFHYFIFFLNHYFHCKFAAELF